MLHFWIALTFAPHMLSGFTASGAKRITVKPGPLGARQPDSVLSFPPLFPLPRYSPTEDDVYVIDFSPTPLSTIFPLQCTKQD